MQSMLLLLVAETQIATFQALTVALQTEAVIFKLCYRELWGCS